MASNGIVKNKIYTYDGHPLTPKEAKFIAEYIETGNGAQSVIRAGYTSKNPKGYANTLLTKEYVSREIEHRLKSIQSSKIASAEEIMEYFSAVMRGEIKDQFDLEASLSERTKAAQELAKRQIDMPNRVSSNETPEVKITLNWEGMKVNE